MTEAFTSLEKVAKDMNLFINQKKTKYMPVTKKSHANYPHHLEVGSYKFQVTHSFTYLGSDISCNNDISEEIQKRILAVNRCFHGLRKDLRSHLTSKNTKILMYKVLIRPILTYASETWTLSKTNERRLSLKERCFDVFLERHKRTGHGEKDTTMNYVKYLMSQTLLIISKLKDWRGQGTWCVWTMIGLLRKYSTPNQMEQEVVEDRNCDGRMVLIKIWEY